MNIFGNAVMAYGVWNNRLGNNPKFFCEKEEVYGTIWKSAYNAVLSCCGRAPVVPSVSPSAIPNNTVSWIAAVSGAVALLLGAVGACAACFAYKKRSASIRAEAELTEWVEKR